MRFTPLAFFLIAYAAIDAWLPWIPNALAAEVYRLHFRSHRKGAGAQQGLEAGHPPVGEVGFRRLCRVAEMLRGDPVAHKQVFT